MGNACRLPNTRTTAESSLPAAVPQMPERPRVSQTLFRSALTEARADHVDADVEPAFPHEPTHRPLWSASSAVDESHNVRAAVQHLLDDYQHQNNNTINPLLTPVHGPEQFPSNPMMLPPQFNIDTMIAGGDGALVHTAQQPTAASTQQQQQPPRASSMTSNSALRASRQQTVRFRPDVVVLAYGDGIEEDEGDDHHDPSRPRIMSMSLAQEGGASRSASTPRGRGARGASNTTASSGYGGGLHSSSMLQEQLTLPEGTQYHVIPLIDGSVPFRSQGSSSTFLNV